MAYRPSVAERLQLWDGGLNTPSQFTHLRHLVERQRMGHVEHVIRPVIDDLSEVFLQVKQRYQALYSWINPDRGCGAKTTINWHLGSLFSHVATSNGSRDPCV